MPARGARLHHPLVLGPRLRVAQGLVGRPQAQEDALPLAAQVLDRGVQRGVGVEPPGQAEVRLLDLVLAGLALDAEHLEMVAALEALEGVQDLAAARVRGQPRVLPLRLLLERAARVALSPGRLPTRPRRRGRRLGDGPGGWRTPAPGRAPR